METENKNTNTNIEEVNVNEEIKEVAEQENETKTEAEKVEPLEEQKPFLYSPYERAILEEMERRAVDNPALAEGLKDKDKSIQECFGFVSNRAKKMATDMCAMIEDSVVYAWAQFYYTQRREIINLEYEKPKPKPTYNPPAKKAEKKEDKKGKEKKEKAEKAKADAKESEKKKEDTDKNTEKVKGGDGKVYTITNLALF